MQPKKWLGQVLVYLVLEIGALCGVPMRPDQIEELMRVPKTRISQAARPEDTDQDGPCGRGLASPP